MTARGGSTLALAAVTTVAFVLAVAGRAAPEQRSERPRGGVLDCHTQSGNGAGVRQFWSRWNLVVGPLVMQGGAARPAFFAGWGNKFQVYVRGGHRVTVAVAPGARPGAGLAYGPRPEHPQLARDGYRVVTFVACRRGEISRGSGTAAWPLSFWAGKVLARSPRCVPLLFWVDDEPSPRRATIYLGVRDCG